MKHPLSRLLTVSALLLALPAAVQAQFTYSIANHMATITGYSGAGGPVTVPDLMATYPVVNIQAGAFSSQSAITSIRLPNTVTNIGDNAFFMCDGLTNAELGTGVSYIGNQAFYQCVGLTNFTLPSTVRSVGDSAFAQCQSLASITIPDSTTNLGDYAFNNCTALTHATVGNGVVRIGGNAFSWCGSLTNVVLGNGVTSIGDNAFAECLSLPSIAIPNGVTNIELSAFSDCGSLTNVLVGSGVTKLGQNVFEYCTRLVAVYFQGNAPLYDDNIFLNDSLVTVYYLADTLDWSSPFAGRPAVVWSPFTYTISNGQVTITGYNGPGGPIAIPSVLTGLPVSSIGAFAFLAHTNLTSIMLPSSITNIGNNAFQDCPGLATLAIPNGVIGIGSGVFDLCSHLTTIAVGDQNPAYASVDGVLFNKAKTTLLRYPEGKGGNYRVANTVDTIEAGAFLLCTGLNSVNVPDSVVEIWNGAFAFCPNLNSVTIGKGIQFIADYVFASSTNLTAVYFKGSAPAFGTGDFNDDPNAIVYYLPWASASWSSAYPGRPVTVWDLEIQTTWANFGVRTNQYGFAIAGSHIPVMVVVVEACTNLSSPNWVPISTNTLTSYSTYFSDPQWTNYPGRFYRLSTP